MSENHWEVSVNLNGENLVRLESNCISGKEEFSEEELQTIRSCADALLSFAGNGGESSFFIFPDERISIEADECDCWCCVPGAAA